MTVVFQKKKRAKKDTPANALTMRRLFGVLLFAFGAFSFVALASFIGSEGNWLGPIFGKAFPGALLYVFGRFSATLVSVAVSLWGVRLLLPGAFPRFSRVCVGFSCLSLLFPPLLSLASTFSGALSLKPEALYGAGGRLGFFMVQSLVWPIFGTGNALFPFLVFLAFLLGIAVALFGLRPSHFSFLKTPFALWAKFRAARAAERETRKALPEREPARDKSLEKARAKAVKEKNPDWESDYTVFHGKAKPFRGPVGAFDGTIPVSPVDVLRTDAPAVSTFVADGDASNVALREIEEKERYLRENEKYLGALEVRALRDEILHLRQVQQMNDWENNRRTRPSIQGIVERSEVSPALDVPVDGSLAEGPDKTVPVADAPSSEPSISAEEVSENDVSPTTAEEIPVATAQTDIPVTQYDDYVVPRVADILSEPPEQKPDYTAEELDEISHLLEAQLENFKVKGKVLGISTGPMITRFEVEPGPGVKVSRFASLHEDLALALKAKSIRILAPIPGKSLVGVEVPNRKLQTVYCRDIFESDAFEPQPDKLVIALGKDITGNPYTMDLCRAPHVLIAGQTGSGKSVCINTIMASLLFSKTPDELRMILVDPKVVELKLYENIPHLLAPVVTQPDMAVSALKWACVEMDRRYEELARWKVRNIAGYNQKRREHSTDALAEPMENMPFIVIVVDELADLMMVAGKDVEKYIARIAQKARAVGIHLVIATQRPSVNVITGLIKANLPARISFKVASQVDSRTVMDRAGAEKLLGRGDMLYRSGDDSEPNRVHGGFLTDEEVERLADACANQNVHYERLETFDIDDPSEMDEDGEDGKAFSGKLDRLALDVARYGLERGSLSTSEVQRHFSVGFSRAGKIVDQLERLNICGPKCGPKPRVMLVNDEQALYDRWPR